MKKKILLWSTVLFFALTVVLIPQSAEADIYIKKFRHTDAISIMGQTQPAKDEEGATWMTKDKMREDEGKSKSTIVRLDLKKIYVIDHDKKEYTEIDLPVDFEKVLPPEAKQMMQMMQVTAKVTETQEKQMIKKWSCKKFKVEIGFSMMGMNMPMKMDMWVTKDIDIDFDLYENFQAQMLSLQPMFKNFIEEFKKIDGYPVLTEMTMNMMGQETKTREEIVSVEKKDAPEGTYNVPAGYKKSETFNPFAQKK